MLKALIGEDHLSGIAQGHYRQGRFPSIIVEEAENGKETMEEADSFRPDLIFMDIGLPGESGP